MQEKKIRKVEKVSYTFMISAFIAKAFGMANEDKGGLTMFLRTMALRGLEDGLEKEGYIKQTTEKREDGTWLYTDIIVARPEKTKKGQAMTTLEKETVVESWRDCIEENNPDITLSDCIKEGPHRVMMLIVRRYIVFNEKLSEDGNSYEATAETLAAKPDEQ